MNIEFITGFAVVTPDPARSRALYVDALRLPLQHAPGDDYDHSEDIDGAKHFGVWPLSQAAQACFGTDTWPAEHAVPQASVEFEVSDEAAVAAAAGELAGKGIAMVHEARREPWGQTVARLLSPEGLIIGISYAPPMH
jgi:catechol 2,3-dioxygenase-like lactoylglutathione lyase family enzyme